MGPAQHVTDHDLRVVPIEAVALAHFHPGSAALRLDDATVAGLLGGSVALSAVLEMARRHRCRSLAAALPVPAPPALAGMVDDARSAGLQWVWIAEASDPAPPTFLLDRADAVSVAIGTHAGATVASASNWLEHLVTRTPVWVEVVMRIVPGVNDGDAAIHDLSSWVVEHLGPDVPLHLAAPAGDATASLRRARSIALGDGLHYVYTSPVADDPAGVTLCPTCGERVVERRGTSVVAYRLTVRGRCHACATPVAGRFDDGWRGPRLVPLRGDHS